MSQPLTVVAGSLPSVALCGLSRSCTHRAAPTSSCWTGDTLSFFGQWPVWGQRRRNVGLHCKEESQVLDASPSKLEIFLFSWSGIELLPPLGTRCLFML